MRAKVMPQQTSRGNRRFFLMPWLLSHLQSLFYSLGHIYRNPANNLMTAAVIGISLALPFGLYLLLENVKQVGEGWQGSPRISLFLKVDVTDKDAEMLAADLRKLSRISFVDVVDPDAALEEFKSTSGFGDALNALESNPLPHVLLIQPAFLLNDGDASKLLDNLRQRKEVELAQYDQEWVQRLQGIMLITQRGVIILSSMLAFAVLLVVGNTIRLGIHNRREEIEIGKLFGATDGFIRRPFLYTGMFYGLAGSLMAWLLITVCFSLLRAPVSQLSALYHSSFEMNGLDLVGTLLLLLTGCVLGLIGSWFAVRRYLRQMDTPH